jgi:hypothetical protein
MLSGITAVAEPGEAYQDDHRGVGHPGVGHPGGDHP